MPIYKGDKAKITMDVGTNIDGVTVIMKFKKPGGQTGAWNTEKVSSTAVRFTAEKGVLNESGRWSLQAYVPEWAAHGKIASLFISAPVC